MVQATFTEVAVAITVQSTSFSWDVESVPGAVATGSQRIARIQIAGVVTRSLPLPVLTSSIEVGTLTPRSNDDFPSGKWEVWREVIDPCKISSLLRKFDLQKRPLGRAPLLKFPSPSGRGRGEGLAAVSPHPRPFSQRKKGEQSGNSEQASTINRGIPKTLRRPA